MVDDGAMVAAMDSAVYDKLKNAIGGWEPTQRKFRMANGSVVPGTARWKGRIKVKGVEVEGGFEVFDSGGGWKFLFGKPLLEQFAAVHDYRKDVIVLKGEQGKWTEVFNKGLGVSLTPDPTTVLEERGQQEVPSSVAQEHIVLEGSEGPLGGVIVKAVTPLNREVDDLTRAPQENITNVTSQHTPRISPKQRHRKPQVVEVPDEEPENLRPEEWRNAQESFFPVTESELDEWFREERRLRRAETIKLQEELERRQEERQAAWEDEEAQREHEWKAWLRKQRAEPGLRKWFFWRNRLKEPNPPKRLSVDSLGGSSAPPSREVPAKHEPADPHNIDPVITDAPAQLMACPATEGALENVQVQSGMVGRSGEDKKIDASPVGLWADSVGGLDIPPSRGVSNDIRLVNPQHADHESIVPVQALQAEHFTDPDTLGPDFFPDALDQVDDVNLFTRNDGEQGAFRPERVREILRKVKIGPGLSGEQRTRVERLLSEYADCFALSV
ncbi:hypothetical protein F5051DRAFT_447687, partial [Lentinula edodes]